MASRDRAATDRVALAFATQALILPGDGDLVLLRAGPSDLADVVDPARLLCEQSFRPVHDALAERGLRVTAELSGALDADAPAAMVVVNLTRARAENYGNIARGLRLLPPGAVLAVDGAKTDGVDGLARQVNAVLPLEGQLTKSHGRLFWLRRPQVLPQVVASWAGAAAPRANAEGFVTAPGLFSPDHADPGSRRLAAAFDGRLNGRVADLGAGWGWLAHQALLGCPQIATLDLFDAEARALDAARANVTDARAQFHWTCVTALGARVPPYDAVITNPPFHHGHAAETDLGAQFIAAAARILKPSGRLLMVANRQLPYEAALHAGFRHCERLYEDGVYKVISAERPRRADADERPRRGAATERPRRIVSTGRSRRR